MTGTVLESIFAVFSAIGEWIVEAITALVPLFYAEGALTFMGVLAVAGLAIAVVLMLLNIIKGFLHFR